MRLAIICGLLICITTLSHAQKMVFGYVLTAEGDSLSGYLSYRDVRNYRDSFLFSSSIEGDKKRVFNTNNCRGFGLLDPYEVYERWSGTLDMSHVTEKYELIPDSVKNASIFIKNIYKGTSISLYHYHDVKDHYFVKFNGNTEELIQKFARPAPWQGMRSGRAPHHNIIQIFRNQLFTYFNPENNRRLKTEVDFAEYRYKPLVSIMEGIDAEHALKKKKTKKG